MRNRAKQQSAHLVGERVDQESLTIERYEVLLITVERVGKKLLARVQFCIEGRFKTVVCQLDPDLKSLWWSVSWTQIKNGGLSVGHCSIMQCDVNGGLQQVGLSKINYQ